MRFVRYAAFAACMGLSATAFAQGDDDEEEGWIEETVEEEEPAPPPPPPPKKAKKKKKVVIVEESVEENDQTPPAWTRGRRGKPRKTIVAREGEPPPPGYHVEMKSRRNLWIPGVVLLGSGYLASALTSAAHLVSDNSCWSWDGYCGSNGDWGWGFVPLAGPFVIAAQENVDPGWRLGYAVFGTAQVLGLGLTIGGAVSKRPVWVLNRNQRGGTTPTTEVVAGPGNLMVKGTF